MNVHIRNVSCSETPSTSERDVIHATTAGLSLVPKEHCIESIEARMGVDRCF